MNEELLKNLPAWDLSDLYASIDDPKISKTFQDGLAQADAFEKKYRSVIAGGIDPNVLLAAFREYEAIFQEAVKPLIYASLLHAADSLNQKNGAFVQRAQAEYTKIYQTLLFFELELLKLDEQKLRELANAPEVAAYRHYLIKLLEQKPHRLSEQEERIFVDLSRTGNSAFVRLFEEEFASKKFKVEIQGKVEEWPEEKILDLLYKQDRSLRVVGADAMTAGLQDELRRITYIYNVLGEDKQIHDQYAKFSTPEASRHMAEEVTQEMVDTMVRVVSENYAIVHDFYSFKKQVLGLEELYDYDRYAPIPSSNEERLFTYEEAKKIILDSYHRFSSLFGDTAEKFYTGSWIDTAPRHGKRGGAFCSFVTPDLHPYVFTNYTGKSKSVLTLAHELGHGVHAYLMRGQTILNFDTPLVVAETASVFGEMIVFDSLRNTLTDPKEKFALYMGKIEEIFATVFRQQVMYKFEQDFHKARRERGELSPEDIGELWIARQREMFGDSVTLRDDYAIWWSYISHFFHTPFYVYAYVFGELLVLSLYEKFLEADDKQDFVEKYTTMLKAGGSKSPQELVEPFGFDLSSKEFWQGGMEVIKRLVEEAKQLHSKSSTV